MQNERRDHFYNFSAITGGFMLIFIDWYFNELYKTLPVNVYDICLLLQAVFLGT